ncbi:unnamed protein product [marine sediment metagenome]|uniref:Uncharacterized protein n=1 Tax=marine sediment metagenome TaxID=412755 RepID=X0SFH4_9ZZZZ
MKIKNDDLVDLINSLRRKYCLFLKFVNKKGKSKLELLNLLVQEIKERPRNRKQLNNFLNSIAELIVMKENYMKWDMERSLKLAAKENN